MSNIRIVIPDGQDINLFSSGNTNLGKIYMNGTALTIWGAGTHVNITSGNDLIFKGLAHTIGGTNSILTIGNSGDTIDMTGVGVVYQLPSISTHTDVQLTSLTNNDLLQYNGTRWVNKTITGSGISPLAGSTSITTLGTITTGTWNASTISVAKGGLGLTAVTSNHMLYASGANTYSTFLTSSFGRSLLNATSDVVFTGLNADKLDGFHLDTTGSTGGPWGFVPLVNTDGSMGIGRYVDFHHVSNDGVNYKSRLHTDGSTDGELFIDNDKIWNAGNSNLTTIPWSASSLTLNGSLSGVSTINSSGLATLGSLSTTTGIFSSTLNVSGVTTLGSSLNVSGSTVFSSTLGVNGILTSNAGIIIEGSVNPSATNMGGFRTVGTNLILKGNSTGVSGIFFQSEKDGTNINHSSDYGFIQFHAYGVDGSSGESNRLVIGVANDTTDKLVLQTAYNNNVVVSYQDSTAGTSMPEYVVYHAGNSNLSSVDWTAKSFTSYSSGGTKSVKIYVNDNGNLVVDGNLYATGEVSAYGLGQTGGTGGGTSYNRLDLWSDYSVDKSGYVLSAYLGNDLNSRLSAIEGNGATLIETVGVGNAVTSVSKSGNLITFTKGSTFLTSINSLIQDNLTYSTAGTTYGLSAYQGYVLNRNDITAISASTTALTLTRASGNITTSIPTWNQNTTGSAGSVANSLTLTITGGTTEGTNKYTFNGSAAKTLNFVAGSNVSIVAGSGSMTISATDTIYTHPTQTAISVGGTRHFITSLGVNTLGHVTGATSAAMTKSDIEALLTGTTTTHVHPFSGLTSKPTTLVGYGITDAAPMSTSSATLPATIGWYRIASSAVGINRCSARFEIDWSVSSYHGQVTINSGIMYNQDPTLNLIHYSHFGASLTKARIVYHTSYSGNYAYLEVYNSVATAITVNVQMFSTLGWSLVTPSTAGSIPSGYTSQELDFVDGLSTEGQLVSRIASGTSPLLVTSTTMVNNLNAHYLGGYLAAYFSPSGGSSSITTVGTVTSGTWSATDVGLLHGGTNASLSASAGSIVYSTASAMAFSTVGTSGYLLTSAGSGAPTWTNPSNLTVSAATKLQTSRTIWGQNFNGEGNVSGSINNVVDIIADTYSIHNSPTNPYLKLALNGLNWYVQAYQDKLHLGYGITKSLNIDLNGNIGIAGSLNLTTSSNQINSTSAVELALNYAGGGARHTSIFNGQGGFVMRAHANGNVGIGTSEPQYKLDVNGSVRTGTIIIDEHVSDAGIKINNNSNTYSRIRFFDSTENLGTIHAFTSNQFLFNNQKCINIDSMGAVSLGHWNEPNVYVNTVNGCVGISNTNPQFKLDVNGSSRIYGSLHLNNEGWLQLYNGANTSTISLSHNNASSKLDIYDRTLGNWANVEAGAFTCDTITMKNNLSEKFIRSNAWGGAIRLRANSGAATDRGLQLGRVDNNLAFTSFMAFNGDSGNVSIGSTLDNGYKLDVNGSGHYASELNLDYGLRISNAAGAGLGISLFNEPSFNPNYGLMFAQTVYKGTHGAVNGDWATYFTMSPDAGRGWIFTSNAAGTGGNVASISNWGNLTCSGEVTAYSSSDIRLKTNIKPIMSAIDVINKLNPVSYNWNEKAKELNPLKGDSTEYGLIAQELEVVMPELVHEIYNEYKSIDYVKLVPILIKAVQEQQIKIENLEKQIK